MATSPTNDVVDAIHAPVTSVTRRIEICEADGFTPWRPDDDATNFLLDGTISVDGTRDERRNIDLTLDNSSGILKRDPRSGFWYDKIIKVYRGVEYATVSRYSDLILSEHPSLYYRMGENRIVRDLSGWGVHMTRHGFPVAVQPLLRSPDAGKSSRFTDPASYFSTGNLPDSHPAITSPTWTIEAWVRPIGVGGMWGGTIFGRNNIEHRIQVSPSRFFEVMIRDANGDLFIGSAPTPAIPGRVYHVAGRSDGTRIQLFVNGEQVTSLLWSGLPQLSNDSFSIGGSDSGDDQMRGDVSDAAYYTRRLSTHEIKRHYLAGLGRDNSKLTWESQVGEFMIDKIDEARFPSEVKITGRDYTKKCLNAKLPTAMTFDKDTPIETLIRSMATNAGISRFILPRTGITVGDGADFDQGTERWNVMKKIAEASAYELFFNSEGYLVLRKQLDPATSASSLTLQTGAKGNLVDWTKSTTDAEVYNRVICVSEGSDSALPFYGEASNTDMASPTSIQRLGERTWIYKSAFFTSDAQCVSTAQQFLSVKGLESFEVDFSSLVFPWTEAGEIVEFIDPDASPYDPTRFLLTNFSLPMKLGPMTGTAKRVIIVGTPNIGPFEAVTTDVDAGI